MAWLNLARRPGGFVYVREKLVSKGVHAGSETTATIANRAREREDRLMFEALWPKPVAAALSVLYKMGYRANRSLRPPAPPKLIQTTPSVTRAMPDHCSSESVSPYTNQADRAIRV